MKIILLFSSVMVALSSANALAADANITFNGTVSANTCTLAAADATKVLTIPSVAAGTLYAAGGGHIIPITSVAVLDLPRALQV